MPDVFSLNDFSQPNAHSCLLWDLLAAPFTPPSLSSPVYRLYLSLRTMSKADHQIRLMSPLPKEKKWIQKNKKNIQTPGLLLSCTPLGCQSLAELAGEGTASISVYNKAINLCLHKGSSGRPSHCVCGSFPVKLT